MVDHPGERPSVPRPAFVEPLKRARHLSLGQGRKISVARKGATEQEVVAAGTPLKARGTGVPGYAHIVHKRAARAIGIDDQVITHFARWREHPFHRLGKRKHRVMKAHSAALVRR